MLSPHKLRNKLLFLMVFMKYFKQTVAKSAQTDKEMPMGASRPANGIGRKDQTCMKLGRTSA